MTGPDSEGLQAVRLVAPAHCDQCGTRHHDGSPPCSRAQSPVVPSVGAVPVEVPEDALRAGACALANVVRLPDWLQVRALGHDMRPLAQLALAAAYPLIAARVRAETDAAALERVGRVLDVAVAGNSRRTAATQQLVERIAADVYAALQADDALTDHDARVRAEERQRILVELRSELALVDQGGDNAAGTTWREGAAWGLQDAIATVELIAAGSAVPVATPEHDAGCERAYGQGGCACQRRADVDFSHTATGPVATPTDPVDEVKCPGCGATIRARMSDRSTPERGAALEDLEHALTLALQAMAENDCCADEDDPDWRGPAIEQFRQDLRALGVRDAEMDAVGIKAPAEQDGQR